MKNPISGDGRRYANAIRALSMDAVQKANSGHPGAPMGMADIAAVLWREFLRHNPRNPYWANRDRFVLSNGHGSMLLYALLHLSGYDVSIEDLKQFRQLHSKTPGHPEYGYTPGVETTTGPLGQGLANAVGMALAERMLAAHFNRPEHVLVDHFTYVFVGDGCLMEGISHEVCSLAGTLGLGKLIVFYDDNGISIDGEVEGWFTDDTTKRFESYGWQVLPAVDGHDDAAIRKAIEQARAETNRPSLIGCKTMIGFGAPNKQGKEVCHGAPLGEEEIALARKTLGWEFAPFEVPEEIYKAWSAVERGQAHEAAWQDTFEKFSEEYPREAAEWMRRIVGELPADWETQARALIQTFVAKNETVATRKASQQVLQEMGKLLPELVGGSADLAGSNLTIWSGSKGVSRTDYSGNYIYYGVREFGMAAMMNGMALHGGFIPYGGTFLIFSDYARNALRMASLMKQRCIFVLTHDSIGLGEDGPTHQPVEQLASLRLIPNMSVWRPCDQVETVVAWRAGLQRLDGPTVLALSRQNLPAQPRSAAQIEAIERGAYVLLDCVGKQAEAIVMASGSEVELALQAVRQVQKSGYAVRLVSMPALDVFDRQNHDYQEQVLPSQIRRRLAVEAGVSDYWRKYVGLDGKIIGLDRFGESAPAKALFEHFGYTLDNVIAAIESLFH